MTGTGKVLRTGLGITRTSLTTLNNAGTTGATARQYTEDFRKSEEFDATYGVLIVKPRTAGMREMKAAAETVNFMVCLGER